MLTLRHAFNGKTLPALILKIMKGASNLSRAQAILLTQLVFSLHPRQISASARVIFSRYAPARSRHVAARCRAQTISPAGITDSRFFPRHATLITVSRPNPPLYSNTALTATFCDSMAARQARRTRRSGHGHGSHQYWHQSRGQSLSSCRRCCCRLCTLTGVHSRAE